MKVKTNKIQRESKKVENNWTHNNSDLNVGNRKCRTFSVGVQTVSTIQTSESFNRSSTFERDDDCMIVFDSTASKSRETDAEGTTEVQKGSEYVLNEPNTLHNNEAWYDEECSVIFDSTLETSGIGNYSLNSDICNSEIARTVCSTAAPHDRQMMQILAAREMTKCRLDVDEVVLDFEPAQLHQVSCRTDFIPEAIKRELLSQGISIRYGKWSKQEDKILLRNYYNFVEKYDIDNPVLLFGHYGCGRKEVQKFIRAKKFYFHLGRDLDDRPVNSIYRRARHLFDSWYYKGHFSKGEIRRLIALQRKFGNKWSTIALHLNRPAQTCAAMYYYFVNKSRSGQWTAQEDVVLLNAVRRHVGKTELLLKFRGYPWKKIAKDVLGRNALQCRRHWLAALCWKLRVVDQPKWKRSDSALLIYLLYSNMVEDETLIDWDLMYHRFKACVASYVRLQDHWHRLKSKVPNSSQKDHESIVIYLYKNYLPTILEKCNISESDLKDMVNYSNSGSTVL